MSFVYPYDFVRATQGGHAERRAPGGHASLDPGRLSGVLYVALHPESPLFLPAATPRAGERGATGEAGHCVYDFVRDEAGLPTLPATSLKGVARATYEALTRSCFSIFAGAKTHFGLRYNPRQRTHRQIVQLFRPGRVERMPSAPSGLGIRACTTVWLNRSAAAGLQEGAPVGFSYRSTLPSHGAYYLDVGGRLRRRIRRKPRSTDPFMAREDPGSPLVGYLKPGWLLRPSEGRVNHHHEILFVPNPRAPLVPIPEEARKAYDRLVSEQAEFAKTPDYETRSGRGQLHELREWDLVYFRDADRLDLARTAIPRVSSRFSAGDLLPRGYHPCSDAESLCPACRVFGMAGAEGSYRGHLRFGAVRWHPRSAEGTPWRGLDRQLRVQGAPHPESPNLYVVDAQRNNLRVVDYDTSDRKGGPAGQLRGRKRYWVREWERVERRDYEMPAGPYAGEHQNITAELLAPEDGHFSFEVRFEQLEPWELGALLFALDLPWADDKKGRHLVGRGKPLGLGICRLEVDRGASYTVVRVAAWRELGSPARQPLAYGDLVAEWRQRIGESFNGALADLELLTTPRSWPIRYPRFKTTSEAQMGEKTFEWFGRQKDTPLPLPEHAGEAEYQGDGGPDDA